MKKEIIIDVREPDEFHAEHIPGSLHVPLAEFQADAAKVFRDLPSDASVLIMCRSGKRAGIACDQVKALGLGGKNGVAVFEGGILEWKKQNRPTNAKKPFHLPIMRQVQIIAGSLVLISSALGYWINPSFLLLGAFVGAGLTFAGATGYCGMAILLCRAPWNRMEKGDCKI